MTHGENLRVLLFEVNVREAAPRANLPDESIRPLRQDLVSKAGKPGIAPAVVIRGNRSCNALQTSSGTEGWTA